jgi:hypothetical protein
LSLRLWIAITKSPELPAQHLPAQAKFILDYRPQDPADTLEVIVGLAANSSVPGIHSFIEQIR